MRFFFLYSLKLLEITFFIEAKRIIYLSYYNIFHCLVENKKKQQQYQKEKYEKEIATDYIFQHFVVNTSIYMASWTWNCFDDVKNAII